MANNSAVVMFRGDSYPIAFTLRNAATRAVIDLTGCSLVMTVDSLESPEDDSTKLFDVTGVLADNPTTGVVYFTPSSLNTATVGEFYYDIEMEDADDNIRTIVKSTFTIKQDITKA